MKKTIRNCIAGILGAIGFLTVSPVYAQITINNSGDINKKILCPIFGWMFTFLISISSVMFLVGAYFYLTSGGNSEKVERANKTLLYAVAGIAVALVAKAFPTLVSRLFGGGDIAAC